jgi:hypothetical protein
MTIRRLLLSGHSNRPERKYQPNSGDSGRGERIERLFVERLFGQPRRLRQLRLTVGGEAGPNAGRDRYAAIAPVMIATTSDML